MIIRHASLAVSLALLAAISPVTAAPMAGSEAVLRVESAGDANPLPSEAEQVRLVHETMEIFLAGVKARTFEALRDHASLQLRNQRTLESVNTALGFWFKANITGRPLDGLSPVFTKVPVRQGQSNVQITGYFATQPQRLLFEIEYAREGLGWRWTRISVNVDDATPRQSAFDAASDCNQGEDAQRAIRGCAALIDTAATDKENRAIAHSLRARAYDKLGNTRLAFRDHKAATELSPSLIASRASLVLLADSVRKGCTPWPSAGAAEKSIESCSTIVEEGAGFFSRSVIGRARVDRGLLLKAAGRRTEATADFAAVAAPGSGADAGDVRRANEELAAVR